MIHFTGSNDIGDPTKGSKEKDHEDQCMYCKAYGVKFVDTDNEHHVCEDCAPKYVSESISDCGEVYLNGYEITENQTLHDTYGYYFYSRSNPLSESFTDPTIEGGLKRIQL